MLCIIYASLHQMYFPLFRRIIRRFLHYNISPKTPAPAPLCSKKAETGSFHCVLLLRQCLCIEVLARLGAHGHVVLCEGADPRAVGGVREDDVLGAELLLRSVDGGIPCGAVHNLRPAREVARVVRHLGDDIVVCHDPIKAQPFAAIFRISIRKTCSALTERTPCVRQRDGRARILAPSSLFVGEITFTLLAEPLQSAARSPHAAHRRCLCPSA